MSSRHNTYNGNSNPLSEAKQITSSLKRIRKSMELGLHQADIAVSVLAEDGESIRDTVQDHKYELKNALQHTKKNLNRVKNIEERERYSLLFSMSFFTCTVIYIITKRLRLLSLTWLTIQGLLFSTNKTANIKISSSSISIQSKTNLGSISADTIKRSNKDGSNHEVENIIDENLNGGTIMQSFDEEIKAGDQSRLEAMAQEQARLEAIAEERDIAPENDEDPSWLNENDEDTSWLNENEELAQDKNEFESNSDEL